MTGTEPDDIECGLQDEAAHPVRDFLTRAVIAAKGPDYARAQALARENEQLRAENERLRAALGTDDEQGEGKA